MKRFLVSILVLMCFSLCALAESDWDKVYENDADINKPVPVVTDKEFKEAYDFKMGKRKKKKNPYANIQANDMSSLQKLEGSYPTVILTQKFYSDDGQILDEGHYKVVVAPPQEYTDSYYAHFYQGHVLRGKLKMNETKNDYDEKNINYAKIIDDKGTFKFIYGNIDHNMECIMWVAKDVY